METTESEIPERSWLVWGVKSSFLRYVSKLPGSEASVGGGAGFTPSNEFTFPRRNDDEAEGRLEFAGDVHLKAHGGMLDFVIADPELVSVDEELRLAAFVSLSSRRRVEIARLEPIVEESDDPSIIRTYRAGLLEDAVESFNGVYQVGTELAEVRIVTPADH